MPRWELNGHEKNAKPLGLTQNKNIGFDDIRVEKCRSTRHWAVWVNGELLAVTVYKKGALAIRETLCPESQGFNFDSSKTESAK